MRNIVAAVSLICAAGAAPCGAVETLVRVMTYNIHHAEGADGKVDVARIADVIRAAHPDVVCLQEVDRRLARTGGVDMPSVLARKLDMQVAFEPNLEFDGGEYGNATLTRHLIVRHENYRLPGREGAEPRGCLRTVLRVNDVEVEVLNTHLGLDGAERQKQAAAILTYVRDVPTVLAGDLNEDVRAPAVIALLARFCDVAREDVHARYDTFPAAAPDRRIDFILASGPLDVLSSRVFSAETTAVASDHLPFVADLRLPRPRTKALLPDRLK